MAKINEVALLPNPQLAINLIASNGQVHFKEENDLVHCEESEKIWEDFTVILIE